MSSNSVPTVAVIANFDGEGNPVYKAWCFACAAYLSSDKTWATRPPVVTAAQRHLTGKHDASEPAYAPAGGRPNDVKVGEVS